jgi:hypothetical protein
MFDAWDAAVFIVLIGAMALNAFSEDYKEIQLAEAAEQCSCADAEDTEGAEDAEGAP